MTAAASGENRPVHLLVVEGNSGDARSTADALRAGHVWCDLHHVGDGDDAVAFLRRQSPYHSAPRPDLVLVDLDVPGTDGPRVLEEMKTDESLRSIPVVVMTSSESESDVARAYEMRANALVKKPLDLEQFVQVVKSINHFWLTVVRLPGRGQT